MSEIFTKLKLNPKNPRVIHDTNFESLKKKIKSFPKMLEKRPVVFDSSKDFIILGGNRRFNALQDLAKEGFEIKDSYFADCADWTDEEKAQFVITDNIIDGSWDYDLLANEWGELPLKEWGINTDGWIKDEQDPNAEWDGMPEFSGKPSSLIHKTILVHFDNDEAIIEFANLVKQKLTGKTKYIWFPEKQKQDLLSLEVKTENES